MSIQDTAVKYIHSGMSGAPVLAPDAGAMVTLLDAALINGFGLLSVDSITFNATTGEATATISAGHGYEKHQVVTISGADQDEYNGEHRVVYADATTLRFIPATAPTADATGTITAKTSGIGGWEKYISPVATKAMYRSIDAAATGLLLRVDDSNAVTGWDSNGASASVTGVGSATDFDTYSDAFLHSDPAYQWWMKSQSATGAGGERWFVIGDSRLFFYAIENASGLYRCYAFGDVLPAADVDQYAAILIAGANSILSGRGDSGFANETSYGKCLARAYHGGAGAVDFTYVLSDVDTTLGYSSSISAPNLADNAIHFSEVLIEEDGGILRGKMPGIMQSMVGKFYGDGEFATNIDGKNELVVTHSIASGINSSSSVAASFMITPSWR